MKQTAIHLCFLALLALVTSCVPMSDLVYLQDKNDDKKSIEVHSSYSKPYQVQVGDVLTINIKTSDEKLSSFFSISESGGAQQQISPQQLYFSGYTVDDKGNIRVPIMGELYVLGYTLEEIRVNFEKILYEQQLNKSADSYVNVKLAGLRFTVMGEIGASGTKVLYQDKVTIFEAITNSGDITSLGNRKQVQIFRKQPHGYDVHYLDLTDRNVMQSPYFYIQPNDYIYVKPLPQKSWGVGTTGMQTLTTVFSVFSLLTTVILLTRK